jgi:hypothetical protein
MHELIRAFVAIILFVFILFNIIDSTFEVCQSRIKTVIDNSMELKKEKKKLFFIS